MNFPAWPRVTTQDFFCLIFMWFLSVYLYQGIQYLWFTYDDPYLLLSAISTPWYKYFFDPPTYQTISIISFTPMSLLSMYLDYRLFGMNSNWFYVHQVMVIWSCALLIYTLARIWSRAGALVGAGIFLISWPAFVGAHLLMLRHYIEGAVFALICVILYVFKRHNRLLLVCGAFSYLLACLSKEVYVFLPLVLFCFGEGSLWSRVKFTAVMWIVLLGYVFWRMYMLPEQVSVFRGIAVFLIGISIVDVYQVLVRMTENLWGFGFFNQFLMFIVFFKVFIFLIIMYSLVKYKKYHYLLGVLVTLICSFLIIFPLWGHIRIENFETGRLLFHLAIVNSLGVAYFFSLVLGYLSKTEKGSSWLLIFYCVTIILSG